MARLRIAKGGSAADPPHLGHIALIKTLLECGLFDYVIWTPSGHRDDKRINASAIDRNTMTHLTFPQEWLYKMPTLLMIDSSSVYNHETPTIDSLEKLRKQYPGAEITWYTGSDIVTPKEELDYKSEMSFWHRSEDLMKDYKFLILHRSGSPIPERLPENFKVLDGIVLPNFSSVQIRSLIKAGQKFEHLVTDNVAEYIKRRELYGYKEKS